MNILYFGHNHIQNIVYFLENITILYNLEIVCLFNYKYIDRCIEIQNNIDLDKTINNVKLMRKK